MFILSDSQATIRSLQSTKIRSKTVLKTLESLNNLGTKNQVILQWIPAHSGYAGNEQADELAKKGTKLTQIANYPIPKCTWKNKIDKLIKNKVERRWKALHQCHINTVWKDEYSSEIKSLGRKSLRLATYYLSGHSAVNQHLSKLKPKTINKICPYCLEEDETLLHYIGRCPKWAMERYQYLGNFQTNFHILRHNKTLQEIIKFIKVTQRFDYQRQT